MSELSARGLAASLALSGTPAVPLWNSFALFISDTAFVFWDLCGIEFCILKVLPTGFTSNSGRFSAESSSKIAPHKQRNNRRRAKKHSCGYPLPVYNSKSLVWKGHHESENWIFNRQTEAAVLELTRISVYFDTRCYNDDLL